MIDHYDSNHNLLKRFFLVLNYQYFVYFEQHS